MRVYEELFIVKPDAPDEEVDAYIEQVKGVITSGQGTVDKVDKWGVRKLAYRVARYSEGVYILVVFSSGPELVHEIERRMRVTDMVIKFITVRVDEKQKKIDKRKKKREKRAARRPPPQLATPAAPMPASPAAPGAVGEHALPGAPAAADQPAPAAPVSHPAPAAPVASVPAAEGKE